MIAEADSQDPTAANAQEKSEHLAQMMYLAELCGTLQLFLWLHMQSPVAEEIMLISREKARFKYRTELT